MLTTLLDPKDASAFFKYRRIQPTKKLTEGKPCVILTYTIATDARIHEPPHTALTIKRMLSCVAEMEEGPAPRRPLIRQIGGR